MAYQEKRKGVETGTWIGEVQVQGKTFRCRETSEALAEAWERRMRAGAIAPAQVLPLGTSPIALHRAQQAPKGTPTLKEFYTEVRAVLWGTARTREEIYRVAEEAIVAMGNPKVSSITKKELNALVTKLQADGKGPKRIKNMLVPIGRLLAEAEEYGYLNAPKLPRIKDAERKRDRVVTPEEEAKLLGWLRDKGREVEADLFELLIITGCRVDELLQAAPSWLRADEKGWFIQLTKEVCKNKTGRKVRLAGRGLEIAQKRLPFGLLYNLCQFWFAKARDAIGLGHEKDFVIHALRHTCATRLRWGGAGIADVQEYIGHKSITMTRRYFEEDDNAKAALAEKMGAQKA